MVEKNIRHNGVNPDQGATAVTLARAVANVLYSLVPRALPEVRVALPGVAKTVYRRTDRTDSRGILRGIQVLERRQPRHSEVASSPRSHRGRGGNLLRQS